MLFSKLFGKKEMDKQAAEKLWAFFAAEQENFINILNGEDSRAKQVLIGALDQLLCPVFPYEKPERVEFQLGSNNGVHEFSLYHGNRMPLAKDMHALCEMMPESVRDVWKVSLSE